MWQHADFPGPSASGRLLVFDCHEAWVYQLSWLGRPMDIIVGLRGRSVEDWDTKMRPVPANSRLLSLSQAVESKTKYDCIVCHNLTDLLDAKTIAAPHLLMLHSVLEGIAREQHSKIHLDEFRSTVAHYLQLTRTHAAAVSALKARSWRFVDHIVPLAVNPLAYHEPTGELARGLRVANQINRKRNYLLWEFHEAAFSGIPLTLIGRNDDMRGVAPAKDWSELKTIFRDHRFYVHTADPRYEDGYNMAMLEAMAACLPVLGNKHPTSPITHGVDGFLSNDPEELRRFALLLLRDKDLAREMGVAARHKVAHCFTPAEFQVQMSLAMTMAQQKHAGILSGNPMARQTL